MFPVTITLSNAAQLNAVMSALAVSSASTIGVSDTIAQQAANKVQSAEAQQAKNPAPVASEKVDAPTPSSATEQASAPEPSAGNSAPAQASTSPATIDNAKALTLKLVSAKGAEFTRALLGEFGVPVAAKLAADQVAAFIARAEKALAS